MTIYSNDEGKIYVRCKSCNSPVRVNHENEVPESCDNCPKDDKERELRTPIERKAD